MTFSKTNAKQRRSRLSETEYKLKERQGTFDTNPTANNVTQMETLNLNTTHIQGNVICSRVNWYEHGEKNNKYILNLQSRKTSNSCVRKPFDKGGKLNFITFVRRLY